MTKHNWTFEEVEAIYQQPFADLLFEAQTTHRQNFDPNAVQSATLLNIKTGACPEDCKYCSQSGRYKTELKKEKLMSFEQVMANAKIAKANGAKRFCMGAAWRSPPKKAMADLCELIKGVKSLGLESCITVGMLTSEQAETLKQAGLDYYNHNLDTSPEYYDKVATTRTYQDRLDTIQAVADAGIKVCCGGIMGLGESANDRISFLRQLANLPIHPQSVPINQLIAIKGTPFEDKKPLDGIEFVRTVATARIIMPKSVVRLACGRLQMSNELQALCFLAGASSIFVGDVLLTTPNPDKRSDTALLTKLGISVATQPIS